MPLDYDLMYSRTWNIEISILEPSIEREYMLKNAMAVT